MPLPESQEHRETVAPGKRATLLQVTGAVFWSFLDVRKGTAMTRDAVSIKPVHVIVAGVVLAAILVLVLVLLVRLITAA